MIVFNNIKFCREELEMNQEDLGEILGVAKSTVSGWENGHDTMPLEKLGDLSNLSKYSANFILGLTNDKSKCSSKLNINKEDIAKRLKQLRTTIGLSQEFFVAKCKVSRTTYTDYEEGKTLINTITLYTICKVFNVSADWILGRDDNMFLNSN